MGTQLPPPKWHSPQFSAHICCGQMAIWIKMSLGMELSLGPGDFVLDGDPAPPPQKGHSPQIFGPCLLRPNGWMDEAGTWHGGRPQPRRLCVRWGPTPPPQNGAEPPIFGPRLLWPNSCMDQDATWHGGRRRPMRHCDGWGPSSPSPKGAQTSKFRPMSVVAKRLDGLRCHLVWR